MTIGRGYKKAIHLKEQTAFDTGVTPDIDLEIVSEDIKIVPEEIISNGINGNADPTRRLMGAVKIYGTIDTEAIPEKGIGLMHKQAFGEVSSAEVQTVTISASNNKIDFDIGGSELHATIDSGTYAIGLTQADTGTLCAKVHAAIVAAEATGTYTVTYSRSTHKITIAETGETVTSFSILWKTGTNTATCAAVALGFAASLLQSALTDSTGAQTYTGTVNIYYCFDHTFTLADEMHAYGLSLNLNRDIEQHKLIGVKVDSLTITAAAKAILMIKYGIIARSNEAGTIIANALSTLNPLTFLGGTISIDSSAADVKNMTVELKRNLDPDNFKAYGQYISKLESKDGSRLITGTLAKDYDSTVAAIWAKFVAGTAATLSAVWTGDTITGSFKYSLTLTFPNIVYQEFTPGTGGRAMSDVSIPFRALPSGETHPMTAVLRNTEVSI